MFFNISIISLLSLFYQLYILDSTNLRTVYTIRLSTQKTLNKCLTNEREKWTTCHPGSILWVGAALLFSWNKVPRTKQITKCALTSKECRDLVLFLNQTLYFYYYSWRPCWLLGHTNQSADSYWVCSQLEPYLSIHTLTKNYMSICCPFILVQLKNISILIFNIHFY